MPDKLIYLIRHAHPDYPGGVKMCLGRKNDLPLSPRGFEQAQALSRYFRDIPLEAVYASPLLRAQQTALDAMRASVGMYDSCNVKSHSFAMHRGKVHYALLPVWMLSTRWRGKDYLFAMNGQTGKLVGDLPMSKGRFWGLFAAVAAGMSLIMFLATVL